MKVARSALSEDGFMCAHALTVSSVLIYHPFSPNSDEEQSGAHKSSNETESREK